MPQPDAAAIERELQSILIRHLPLGFEGVGLAQTEAVIQMLRRRSTPRPRPTLDEQQRRGIKALQETATRHAEHITITGGGSTACGMCLSEDGSPQPWPCPVWQSAELLGAVTPEDAPRHIV